MAYKGKPSWDFNKKLQNLKFLLKNRNKGKFGGNKKLATELQNKIDAPGGKSHYPFQPSEKDWLPNKNLRTLA